MINNFSTRVNEFYKEVKEGLLSNLIKGEYGENFFAAIINAIISVDGAKFGLEAVSAQLTGKNLGKNILIETDPSIKQFAKNKTYSTSAVLQDGTKVLATKNKTAIKTDIVLPGNENFNNLSFSIKNIGLSSAKEHNPLHTLSGVSALQLMQEHGQFLDHYLNIVPQRTGFSGKKADKNYDFSYESQNEKVPGSLRNDLHWALKGAILITSLTGGLKINQNNQLIGKTNVLYVIDNAKGIVHYLDFNQIIFKLSMRLRSIKNIVPGLEVGDLDDINLIKNEWSEGGAQERINQMRQKLHEAHLVVSLSDQDFRNLSSL
jgi:hypothetical protein